MSIKWEKNDSGFYPIDEFTSKSFSDSSGVMHLSVFFNVYSISEHDESNNVRVVIGRNDHDIPFEHGGSLFYKGNINIAKEIVENTIDYFNKKENVLSNENKYKDKYWENQILYGIEDHIQSICKEVEQKHLNPQINLIMENNINMKTREWEYNEKYENHVMEFSFGNYRTYFELDNIAPNTYILNFYQSEEEKIAIDISREINPDFTMDGDKYHQASINGDINYAKTIVEMTSNHFYDVWYETTMDVNPEFINENLNSVVKNIENEYSQNRDIGENKSMKTREEVNELKYDFLKVYDWHWSEEIFHDNHPDREFPRADIENTEGFEEYRDELKTLRLDTLKKQWEKDPCWDIYNTEGFEEYHDELKDYQKSVEQKWEEERINEIKNEKNEAEKLGLHGLYSMIKDLKPSITPNYVQNVIDRNNKINQTADKIGYIQGVCECVAALGDNYMLGKKLLTEMNVNKEMAKKFANPETFKKLEQGIFAQNQEQKVEQTQGVKR